MAELPQERGEGGPADDGPAAGEPRAALADRVGRRAARKLRARGRKGASVWFSLGMIGLVGWSVAVPTLIGVAAGLWLDRSWPSGRVSWTLTLLFAGAALGSFNAWRWVRQESAEGANDEETGARQAGSDEDR